MNKKLLMAFVLTASMALAQAGGGSSGSSGSASGGAGSTSTDQQQPGAQTNPSTQPGTSSTDQNTNNSNMSATSSSSGQETTLRGCLKQSGGNWILSQSGGQDISLNGDTSQLKPHDGHQVEVRGSRSSDTSGGGSLRTGSTCGAIGSSGNWSVKVVRHAGQATLRPTYSLGAVSSRWQEGQAKTCDMTC